MRVLEPSIGDPIDHPDLGRGIVVGGWDGTLKVQLSTGTASLKGDESRCWIRSSDTESWRLVSHLDYVAWRDAVVLSARANRLESGAEARRSANADPRGPGSNADASTPAPVRIIEPPLRDLDRLPTPLTSGERKFLDVLLTALPPSWEIYIQPHLNGLRPDFVLLHPERGVAVYEVKDWDLDALRYGYRKSDPGHIQFVASDGQRTFSKDRDDPVARVMNYKREIFDLYCPDLPEREGFGVITAGVVFPFAPQEAVLDLCRPALELHKMASHPRLYPMIGREQIDVADMRAILPNFDRQRDQIMTQTRASELRHWLVEPDYSIEQRMGPEIDDRQRQIIESRTASGYRRLRGPAGSGKSLVLAGRVANLAQRGKSVLVVTFNITLINYLRDLTRGFGRQKWSGSVDYVNFHLWCKRICIATGNYEEYLDLWRDLDASSDDKDSSKLVLDESMAELVQRTLDGLPLSERPLYDAILVDEAQDYRPSWWQTLRSALRPGGEMMLVSDTTQNVYGTARTWTDDAMKGAGFSGPWMELKGSYRLPENMLPYATAFATHYLPSDTRLAPEPISGQLPFPSCEMRWLQVQADSQLATATIRLIETLLTKVGGPRPASADITVIVPTEEIGKRVVRELEGRNIRSIHTFGERSESRRRKMHFYKGDARIKVTTVKSFKGWESSVIVAVINAATGEEHLCEVYAALTRVRRSENGSFLSVACADPKLVSFGKSWPAYSQM